VICIVCLLANYLRETKSTEFFYVWPAWNSQSVHYY